MFILTLFNSQSQSLPKVDTDERLRKLRFQMSSARIKAYIIPSVDQHMVQNDACNLFYSTVCEIFDIQCKMFCFEVFEGEGRGISILCVSSRTLPSLKSTGTTVQVVDVALTFFLKDKTDAREVNPPSEIVQSSCVKLLTIARATKSTSIKLFSRFTEFRANMWLHTSSVVTTYLDSLAPKASHRRL